MLFLAGNIKAQKVESIHVNLYTDSLKKGTHNYINIDGKRSNGTWMPLTEKELTFTTDYGRFERNNLVLPENPNTRKVTIKVTLKSDPRLTKTFTVWIKQQPDPPLPTNDPDAFRTRKGRNRK